MHVCISLSLSIYIYIYMINICHMKAASHNSYSTRGACEQHPGHFRGFAVFPSLWIGGFQKFWSCGDHRFARGKDAVSVVRFLLREREGEREGGGRGRAREKRGRSEGASEGGARERANPQGAYYYYYYYYY